MRRLAWMTDIHLNFLEPRLVDAFLSTLAAHDVDAFLLSGDIGEAKDVQRFLHQMDEVVQRPIYFVLGNHDFYHGSIAGVRSRMADLCAARPRLCYLTGTDAIAMGPTTALVGHDGWGDGRLGDYQGSRVVLHDVYLIEELRGLPRDALRACLERLGDEAASHFRHVLPDALARFDHIIVVTHVPPFREACWHEGRISNDHWLPWFTCKSAGDALAEQMAAHPTRRMTVLCGHTHGGGEAAILPNLRVLTGEAVYGQPAIQQILTIAEEA